MGGVTTDKVKEINKNSTIYTTRELQERRQRDHNFKRQIQQSFASHGKSLSRMGSKIHRNVREFFDKAEDQVMSDDGAAASYIKRADSQQRQSDNEFSDRLDVDLTDQTVLRHREVLELLLKLKNAERQGREMDAVGAVNGINLENGQLTGEAAANLKGVLDQMRSMRDSLAAEPEEKTKEGSGEEPKEKFGENKEEGLEKKDKEGHEEETQEEPGGEIQEEPGEKTGEESGGETQEEPGEKTKEKHEEKTKYKKEEKEKIVRMLDFYLGHFAYLDGMLDVPENTKDMLVVSLSDLTTDEMLDTDLSVVKLDATQTEVALSERFENFESQVDPDREIVTLPGKYKDAPLFPTMPSMRDVKQGHMEDGYFISSIASIIENDPKQIMKLMRDHGDNTVTVRFFREKPKKNVKQEQGQTQGQAEEQTQAQNIEDIEKE